MHFVLEFTIVFIPGVIDIKDTPVTGLIEQALLKGANINDIGFFNVSGIVWSIIQGDTEAVSVFLNRGASINLEQADSFGNKSVTTWATATLNAAEDDQAYAERMLTILSQICPIDKALDSANNLNKKPPDYLPQAYQYAKESLTVKPLSVPSFQKY